MVNNEIALRAVNGPAEIAHIPEAAQGLVEWAMAAQAAYELAQRLVTTSFAPAQYKQRPDEAAAAILAGAEVGLSPMASLRSFDVIQGVAAPRAITLRAIVQSLGHEIVIDEASPERVAGRGRRNGSKEWQGCEWTIERARALGLANKEQWKKQPQTMLIARFTSEIARLIAADAILGIPYTVEEIMDSDDAPYVVKPRPPKAAPQRVTAAEIIGAAQPADQPPAEPDPTVGMQPERMITRPQITKLHILLDEAGFGERDVKLEKLTEILGRPEGNPVLSSKDLTAAEASACIEELARLLDPSS